MWDNLTVNGFQFESATDYAEAKKEAEAIEYIVSKMDISDPQIAVKVYYKLLDRRNLKTIVGFNFLKELRDFCISSGLVTKEQIRSIYYPSSEDIKNKIVAYGDEASLEIDSAIGNINPEVDSDFDEYDKSEAKEFEEKEKKLKKDIQNYIAREKKLKTVAEQYRNRSRRSICVIAALIVIIITLFSISIYRGNLPFEDIEVEIQDKYARWAEELTQRENELKMKEQLISGDIR